MSSDTTKILGVAAACAIGGALCGAPAIAILGAVCFVAAYCYSDDRHRRHKSRNR
jgi:1,4-dihydroxy-2-naphthoate octaprenyltransferase